MYQRFMKGMIFGLTLLLAATSLSAATRVVGACVMGDSSHLSINAAIGAASAGDTVLVCPGGYVEDVVIDKSIDLLSAGLGVVHIDPAPGGPSLGTIQVVPNVHDVRIGDIGQGFQIIGTDNGSPGIENAAIYFQGDHSNVQVVGNEIYAAGDHGLLTEFGATIDNFLIDHNTIAGATFLGANPAGNGFSMQFSLANVPRQLVVMGGGAGGGNTSNVTFTQNMVTGVAGGTNGSGMPQGNTLVTIDSDGATITGNQFMGTTSRFGTQLRARGPATTISGNTFSSTGLLVPTTGHVSIQNTGESVQTVALNNSFDKGVYVDGPTGTIEISLAVRAGAVPAGSTIHLLPGNYVETSQIHAAVSLNIQGTDRSNTIVQAGFDTGAAGDSRGFFLADDGITFNVSDLTIDGSGWKVYQGIRNRAGGTISNVDFRNIFFSQYVGAAMAAFGSQAVDVQNCTFENMEREGVLYFGIGVAGSIFENNSYTGKGDGDFLDYGVELGAGADVTVRGNTISGNRGVASDGSESAGILATTLFGPGTTGLIEDNNLSDNTIGIAVGYGVADSTFVEAHNNNIAGNQFGMFNTGTVAADATCNWWGDITGPSGDGSGLGDTVDGDILFAPWLTSAAPGGSCDSETPRARKMIVLALLQDQPATGNKKVDKALEQAIKSLEKSLENNLWEDSEHLTKKGNKVFDEERKAVKELENIIKEGGPLVMLAESAIADLVLADQTLARTRIDEAIAAMADAKEIDKAEKEYAKALDELADEDFDQAIDKFKRAWFHADRALR